MLGHTPIPLLLRRPPRYIDGGYSITISAYTQHVEGHRRVVVITVCADAMLNFKGDCFEFLPSDFDRHSCLEMTL